MSYPETQFVTDRAGEMFRWDACWSMRLIAILDFAGLDLSAHWGRKSVNTK